MQVLALRVCNNRILGTQIVAHNDECPLCESELKVNAVAIKDTHTNSNPIDVHRVYCPTCELFSMIPMVEVEEVVNLVNTESEDDCEQHHRGAD